MDDYLPVPKSIAQIMNPDQRTYYYIGNIIAYYTGTSMHYLAGMKKREYMTLLHVQGCKIGKEEQQKSAKIVENE